MFRHNSIILLILAFSSLFVVALLRQSEAADFSLATDVQGVYEDNILLSPADAGKKGDFFSILTVAGSAEKELDSTLSIFLRGDAERYIYKKYTDLNVTALTLSAGASKELGPILSLEASLKGGYQDFSDTERTSKAYGGSIELKQQISFRSWIKEGYEFEKNDANSALFSYTKHSLGIHSGYLLTPKTLLHFGGGFITIKYENAARDRAYYGTLFAVAIRQLYGKIFANMGYSHQFISTTVPNTGDSNNIYSLGLQYRF
jgi:hypothetical protein